MTIVSSLPQVGYKYLIVATVALKPIFTADLLYCSTLTILYSKLNIFTAELLL